MTKDEIVKAIAEMSPWDEEDTGSIFCFFCGALENEKHEVDCVWDAARRIEGVPT